MLSFAANDTTPTQFRFRAVDSKAEFYIYEKRIMCVVYCYIVQWLVGFESLSHYVMINSAQILYMYIQKYVNVKRGRISRRLWS